MEPLQIIALSFVAVGTYLLFAGVVAGMCGFNQIVDDDSDEPIENYGIGAGELTTLPGAHR